MTNMTNLSKEHCAGVLNRWAAHYVAKAEKELKQAQDSLTEERIQLRIAEAVDAERKRLDPYDGVGGFGEPTPAQRFKEIMARRELDYSEAIRVLQNNKDMAEYIKEITSNEK